MTTARARELRKTMTRQEVKLWVRLRELRALGFHFRRQSPIGCTSWISNAVVHQALICDINVPHPTSLRRKRLRSATLPEDGEGWERGATALPGFPQKKVIPNDRG